MIINIAFEISKFTCLNWMLQSNLIDEIIAFAIWHEIKKQNFDNGKIVFIEDKYTIYYIEENQKVLIYLTEIYSNKCKYIGQYRKC